MYGLIVLSCLKTYPLVEYIFHRLLFTSGIYSNPHQGNMAFPVPGNPFYPIGSTAVCGLCLMRRRTFYCEDCIQKGIKNAAGVTSLSSSVFALYNLVTFTSWFLAVRPEKNRLMSIKLAQNWFYFKNDRFWLIYKNSLRMWEIWAN